MAMRLLSEAFSEGTNNQPPRCGQSTAAAIANWADKISVGAGVVAVGAGAAGLIAAPTGAGFLGLEGVAAAAGFVSLSASFVGGVAHYADHDYIGGLLDFGGIVGGYGAGAIAGRMYASTRMFGNLSATQMRQVQLISNASGTALGAASSLYSCSK